MKALENELHAPQIYSYTPYDKHDTPHQEEIRESSSDI
jgi:hypothetical protein